MIVFMKDVAFMENILKKKITEALEAVGIVEVEPMIEYPNEFSHGDFATNAAMVAAKQADKNPKTLAEELVHAIGEIEGVENIEVAAPGFINFTLSREYYSNVLQNIGINWGKNTALSGKRIIVEYSQPNPFKPFHIGHLMSTTVGESISRLVEFSGANIFRANYQGDIGPHIAKCIWGLQKKALNPASVADLGDAYVAGSAAYEDSAEAKAEIDSINKRLYAHDAELQPVYDAGRATSLAHFDELYTILGTKFDHLFFESQVAERGVELVREGLAKGIFEESEGAVVYKGEKKGLHTRVFITSQNNPTYEAKEVALAEAKNKVFPYDLNITTIAVEQDNYFTVVEAALAELLPQFAGKYTHIAFGIMQLTGGKMSSRKGNIITGESLVEDMRAKALAKMEGRDLGDQKQHVADAVAVSAIKHGILKQARGKNIIFDPEASLSFEGDSGPYLQYSYVRAKSVLEKAGGKDTIIYDSVPDKIPAFERLLPRFPSIVLRAAKEYEPHYVTTYLTELASAFNGWYAEEKIIGSSDEAYKLRTVEAFAHTMKNGLWLLGIDTPEKM